MGWEQLKQMIDAGRKETEEERFRDPIECPIDGTPLVIGKNGVRNCPMGNYKWPNV